MAVKHTFTSTIEDGADNTLVQPSDWNAEHVLSNALGAIDALTPAASKIPYFNGADSATLADITATGISLLGVADAAAGRTALGLGTIATQAADSVSLTGGSISGMTSIGGTLLSLASSSGAEHIFCKTNDTSNSNQSCIFVLRHYTSASEESATAFRLVSESGVNQLYLGGGALDHNACTMIKFFTASNYTTKYGTERGRVTNGGRWLFGTTTDDGSSNIQTDGVIKADSLILMGGKLKGSSSLLLHPNTSDGADSGVSYVCGGGWPLPSRGGYLEVRGNESASFPGDVRIISGGDSTFGNISLWTGGGYERFRITPSSRILAGPTIPTDNGVDALQVNGTIASTGYKLSALNTAPASASATGTLGEIRITSDAIYICTATNTWKKVAIATW